MTEHPGEQVPGFDPEVEPGQAPEPEDRPAPDYDTEPDPDAYSPDIENSEQTFGSDGDEAPDDDVADHERLRNPGDLSPHETVRPGQDHPAHDRPADDRPGGRDGGEGLSGSAYEGDGHPLVEETMARLDTLRDRPVSEHAEVYAELHERLQTALVEADAETGDRG